MQPQNNLIESLIQPTPSFYPGVFSNFKVSKTPSNYSTRSSAYSQNSS